MGGGEEVDESSCPSSKLKIGASASELSSFRIFCTGSSSVQVNTTIPFAPKFVSPARYIVLDFMQL